MIGDFLAGGWDQSKNHGAVVVLDRSGRIVHRGYVTDKAKWAALGEKEKIARRIPKPILDEEDPDVRAVTLLAYQRAFFQGEIRKIAALAAGRMVAVGVENYPYRMAQGAHQLGEIGGTLRCVLWDAGFKVRLYGPESPKIYGTGRGDATAPEIAEEIKNLGVDFDCYGLGRYAPSEDLAVAFTLARMVRTEILVRAGEVPLDSLPDQERRILLRVTKHAPVGVLDRPFVERQAGIPAGW